MRSSTCAPAGASASCGRRLRQGSLVRAEVLITAGTLPDEAPRYVDPTDAAAPVLPPPGRVHPFRHQDPDRRRASASAAHLDMRLDPATTGWIRHEPSGQGVVRGWIRRADGAPIDPYWLLIVGDAPPPVTFDLGHRGWVPTVTLDAHIRALPAPGLARSSSRRRSWSPAAGSTRPAPCGTRPARLVASVRQLAGYRES